MLTTTEIEERRYGEKHDRSIESIELDITLECNLGCFNCDRSCRQAPSTEKMTCGQIEKFVKESVEKNYLWKNITVLGGEPTMHPDLLEIINILIEYKKRHSPRMRIQLKTNGFGKDVNDVLSTIPIEVEIVNSEKKSAVQEFEPFNIAPTDRRLNTSSNFSNGCWIAERCGMGLNRYGFYHCGPGGAIDRIFGFGLARKSLPEKSDRMRDEMNQLCRYCGHLEFSRKITKEKISPSWEQAYSNYKLKKPKFDLY